MRWPQTGRSVVNYAHTYKAGLLRALAWPDAPGDPGRSRREEARMNSTTREMVVGRSAAGQRAGPRLPDLEPEHRRDDQTEPRQRPRLPPTDGARSAAPTPTSHGRRPRRAGSAASPPVGRSWTTARGRRRASSRSGHWIAGLLGVRLSELGEGPSPSRRDCGVGQRRTRS